MPKSKEQKREEAVERARYTFPHDQRWWQSKMRAHLDTITLWGKEEADRRIREHAARMIRLMTDAQCDDHGNPRTGHELANSIEMFRKNVRSMFGTAP
jgi:hypothetical protein